MKKIYRKDDNKHVFYLNRSMEDYAKQAAKWILELSEYPGAQEFGDKVTLFWGRWQAVHNKRAAERFQKAVSKECEKIIKGQYNEN